jgi:hypothetical protein
VPSSDVLSSALGADGAKDRAIFDTFCDGFAAAVTKEFGL